MKNINFKNLLVVAACSFLFAACESDDKSTETTFYKKESVREKKLELTIEASGVIEAISSVEIKSKASGEILYLGAEVGDFVEKGSMLGQIDQRTPTNILDQSESDLEASKVRLENA
jgi:HlyD family secretion protein